LRVASLRSTAAVGPLAGRVEAPRPMCEQAIARRSKGDCEAAQPMKAPDLADEAKAFSVFIECR